MNLWNTVIIQPFSWLITFLYNFTGSYGMAIILFTLATKIILLPLTIKQQKSMVQMQRIQPLMAKIQAKYKNDQEKLSQETMKLYKEHHISPFSGCLPLLIQLPIIYALYFVIRNAAEYTKAASYTFLGIFDLSLTPHIPDFSNMAGFWSDPNTPLLLIPILSVLATFLQSIFTNGIPKKKERDADGKVISETPQQPGMGMMKYMMPLFSGYIAFIVPAGVGLYWIASGVFQIIQQILITYFYTKKLDQKSLDDKGVVSEQNGKTNRNNGKKHR